MDRNPPSIPPPLHIMNTQYLVVHTGMTWYFVIISEQYATLFFWLSSSILSLKNAALSWHLSATQFLVSLWRPLGKDLSLFLDPLSQITTTIPQKHSVLQLLKPSWRPIFFRFICTEVQVLVSVCITQEVCVCVCVCVCMCVCVCVIISLYGWVFYVYIAMVFGFYGYFFFFLLFSWMFQQDCLDTCCFEWLICMCLVVLYLHLFSAVEHVSHGKTL